MALAIKLWGKKRWRREAAKNLGVYASTIHRIERNIIKVSKRTELALTSFIDKKKFEKLAKTINRSLEG